MALRQKKIPALSVTESPSKFQNLQDMSVMEIITGINKEDAYVQKAVQEVLPQIEELISQIVERMKKGGRLFYLGAGTSGRLGVLDASEVPPTYGVSPSLVIGLIAGGDIALRKAVENAEDDPDQAWKDLIAYNISSLDSVIGIAASGTTPYVIGGINNARKKGILTGCITCNPGSLLAKAAEYPIEAIAGPEFVTGSTRMKSGTAQKMILNMISTTLMIKLGKVQGNKMVNMQLNNKKLVKRGTLMLMEELSLDYESAQKFLLQHGSVKKALEVWKEQHSL
jgi:N-acetylmuramic acid 6-phosphate etherase